MTATEAADYLRNKMRGDLVIRDAVQTICQARGYRDLYDWANKDPDSVILYAQSEKDLEPQLEQFETDLEDVTVLINTEESE